MSAPNTARFFDSKMALLGGGTFVAGIAFGAYCVSRVVNERRISVGGFLFAIFLLVAGVALFAGAFPKGCRSCSKRFTEGGTTFPAQNYDQLVAIYQQANVAALAGLAAVPAGSHEGWTGLGVKYCAGCRQLGEVTISEQRAGNQSSQYIRGTGTIILSASMLAATLQMLERRPTPTASN